MADQGMEDDVAIPTVRAKVLVSFPYSHEPWQQPRRLPVGEVLEIRTELHEGLVKAGLIEIVSPATKLTVLTAPAAVAPVVPVVEDDDPRSAVIIPDRWQDLPWPDQRSLAAKVKAPDAKIVKRDDVAAAIKAELDRRAARPVPPLPAFVVGTSA